MTMQAVAEPSNSAGDGTPAAVPSNRADASGNESPVRANGQDEKPETNGAVVPPPPPQSPPPAAEPEPAAKPPLQQSAGAVQMLQATYDPFQEQPAVSGAGPAAVGAAALAAPGGMQAALQRAAHDTEAAAAAAPVRQDAADSVPAAPGIAATTKAMSSAILGNVNTLLQCVFFR